VMCMASIVEISDDLPLGLSAQSGHASYLVLNSLLLRLAGNYAVVPYGSWTRLGQWICEWRSLNVRH
jgi:hypothetical protein